MIWVILRNLNESGKRYRSTKMSAVGICFDKLVLHPTQWVTRLFLLLFLARQGIWSFWPLPFLLLWLYRLWLSKHLLLHHSDGLGLVRCEPSVVPLLLHFAFGQLWGLLQGGWVAMKVEHRCPRHCPHRSPAPKCHESSNRCHHSVPFNSSSFWTSSVKAPHHRKGGEVAGRITGVQLWPAFHSVRCHRQDFSDRTSLLKYFTRKSTFICADSSNMNINSSKQSLKLACFTKSGFTGALCTQHDDQEQYNLKPQWKHFTIPSFHTSSDLSHDSSAIFNNL